MSNWGRQSAGAALAAIYAYLFAKMGVLSVNLVRREDRMKWNNFQAEKLLMDTAAAARRYYFCRAFNAAARRCASLSCCGVSCGASIFAFLGASGEPSWVATMYHM